MMGAPSASNCGSTREEVSESGLSRPRLDRGEGEAVTMRSKNVYEYGLSMGDRKSCCSAGEGQSSGTLVFGDGVDVTFSEKKVYTYGSACCGGECACQYLGPSGAKGPEG
jgi:hypothetical protein